MSHKAGSPLIWPFYIENSVGGIWYGHIRQGVAKYRGSLRQSRLYFSIFRLHKRERILIICRLLMQNTNHPILCHSHTMAVATKDTCTKGGVHNDSLHFVYILGYRVYGIAIYKSSHTHYTEILIEQLCWYLLEIITF